MNEQIAKAAEAVYDAIHDHASEVTEVEDILFERLEKHFGKRTMELYWEGKLSETKDNEIINVWNKIHDQIMAEVFKAIGDQLQEAIL